MSYIPDCYLAGGCETCLEELDIENYCPYLEGSAVSDLADALESASKVAHENGKHEDAGFQASGDLPEDRPDDQPLVAGEKLTVTPFANGPLLLQGSFTVQNADGSDEITRVKVSLCRCGGSGRKPFCDGSHKAIGFTTE